jgi:hypothetical protein
MSDASRRTLENASLGDRRCGWCHGAIPAGARRDSIFCSVSHRQAAHRTKTRRLEQLATDRPLRLAYADPPYPGQSGIYRGHPDYAGEVDLRELVSRLATYDGWALSTSARALPDVLAMIPVRTLVAAWIRGGRPHATARLVNAWEPVIFVPARFVVSGSGRDGSPVLDALVGPTPRRRATLPTAVIGAKPPEFCAWVFDLLGARIGDSLDDLYPGSGIVGRTWEWTQGRDPSRAAAADASRLARAGADASSEVLRYASALPGSDASLVATALRDGSEAEALPA